MINTRFVRFNARRIIDSSYDSGRTFHQHMYKKRLLNALVVFSLFRFCYKNMEIIISGSCGGVNYLINIFQAVHKYLIATALQLTTKL